MLSARAMKYSPSHIEPKWQKAWRENGVFKTPTDLAVLKQKPKYYILDMFPYPSGAGLHVGHPEGYTATDVLARLKRMQGFHVLHPMGWDAFGLPAERAAMRSKRHPAEITKENISNFKGQIERLGFSYDWDRELSTTDEDYYKWTQWIFLKLYERGLAYMAEVPVNWCPALGTVLANEEVKDGVYVETGDKVERRLMKQWMLKITAYAERLLEDLEELDWPEGVKEMQRNWIGKSYGAEIEFHVKDFEHRFTVYTTRPDTLFGATYCVLAPEHDLLERICSNEQREAVEKYQEQAKHKTDLARTDLAKEKTGVFTGAYAVHPVTGKPLPIWIADYVLITYGTGSIMAVPAHDERDHEFAKTFSLPILEVISGSEKNIQDCAYAGDGKLINSDFLNGLDVEEAKKKMLAWLEEQKKGTSKIQYRLRDWLFSRQRYWGEPIPVLHFENGSTVPVSESDLPITLPQIDEYAPTEDGEPPLARADKDWLCVDLPQGKAWRETNTMPQWAGSCWYYLRYIDPKNKEEAWSADLEKYWMPVDLYIGGVEHAVLHLLYARFWHKVLFDCGYVSTKEPFQKLFNQGMILAYSYQDARGKYYHPDEVTEKEGKYFTQSGDPLVSQVEKMSKSKQNVVNPDDVVQQYGADAMRLYELFMGPLESSKPWQMDGVEGINRFLSRVWRLVIDEQTGEKNQKLQATDPTTEPTLLKALHKTIKKVNDDTTHLQFNTAISQMMIFINEASHAATLPLDIVSTFLKLLNIYAPHIAEELWQQLGMNGFICQQRWPSYDEKLTVDDTIQLVVQINGKKKETIEVARDASQKELEKIALENEKIKSQLEGKTVRKIIVVPSRLVNIVAT